MEFDENKKLDVEVSENNYVENRVNEKRKKRGKVDFLDLAIIPVIAGVFVSLGFLFANIFKATAVVDALKAVTTSLFVG